MNTTKHANTTNTTNTTNTSTTATTTTTTTTTTNTHNTNSNSNKTNKGPELAHLGDVHLCTITVTATLTMTMTTPGLHNKIPALKIFARGWVAQESICLHYQR